MIEMKKAYYADYIYYNNKIHKNSYLLTDADIILGISDNLGDLAKEYEIIRYENSAIFPALINTHTHLGMSLFRGFADDLELMTWLKDYIWKVEKKYVSEEFVYIATLLSIIEMIRSGTSTANEMYFYPNATAKAFTDAKLRVVVGFGALKSVDSAIESIEAFKTTDKIRSALCPHALYTVGKDGVQQLIEYAKPRDILIHTHLAETVSEVEMIKEKYGSTPALIMDEIGGFDCKSIFAHAVHLTDEEISIMGSKNVNISHCLDSNLKLASGIAPIVALDNAGANITIGTDGAASNNDQSMICEMGTVAKIHKAISCDASALPAEKVLNFSTTNAANALQFTDTGILAKGKQVDFFVLSFNSAHMTPVYNPISHLLYSANNNDITDMIVGGEVIMKDRVILTIDEEFIKSEARKIAKIIKI